MDDIVKRQLEEWSSGKDLRGAMIAVFEGVRDIPYEVVPHIRNSVEGPREILKYGRGSCTPKHFLLGQMFEALGVGVRYITFPFRWERGGLEYPNELRELARAVPTEYHHAIQAKAGDRWVYVDATWDLPLEKVGAPVNRDWDGMSDTRIAVDYDDEIVHASARERDEYVVRAKSAWTAEENAAAERFVTNLNAWLRQVRGDDRQD